MSIRFFSAVPGGTIARCLGEPLPVPMGTTSPRCLGEPLYLDHLSYRAPSQGMAIEMVTNAVMRAPTTPRQ